MTTQLSAAAPPDPGAPEPAPGRAREWLRAALSPRMLGILLLLLLAAGACIRLGAWQLDRAAIRGATEAETAHAERLDAEPAPISAVLPAQTSLPADDLGRRVTATGAFDPEQQVLVPGREVEGQAAVLVVTAFWVTEGPDAGAMLPVLRGWVPEEDLPDGAPRPTGAAVAEGLAAPEGERQITGHLSASEISSPADLPAGMLGAISAGQLTNLWGGPSWSAYAVLVEGDPAHEQGALRPAPPPSMAGETGLNLQNLAYAAEWWIFGGFALFLWWRMLRDEVVHRRQEAELGPGEGDRPGQLR